MDVSKNFQCVDHSSMVSSWSTAPAPAGTVVPVQNYSNIPPAIDIHWPESAPEVEALKKDINRLYKDMATALTRLAQLEVVTAQPVEVRVLPVEMPPVRVELPEWLKAAQPSSAPMSIMVFSKQTPVGVAMAVAPFLYILGWVLYASLTAH
jgi:hypothetical protein